jgi:hypothetical protein
VTLVEDEWTREIETMEDLDLLFVTYDPQKITVEKMLQTIKNSEYDPIVKQ